MHPGFHSSFVIACFLDVILDVVLAVICSISASLSIPEAKPPYPLKAVFPRLLLVLDTLDISAALFQSCDVAEYIKCAASGILYPCGSYRFYIHISAQHENL